MRSSSDRLLRLLTAAYGPTPTRSKAPACQQPAEADIRLVQVSSGACPDELVYIRLWPIMLKSCACRRTCTCPLAVRYGPVAYSQPNGNCASSQLTNKTPK